MTAGSLVTTGVIDTATDLDPGGAQGANSDAVVKDTKINLGGALIKATVLESHATVRCGPNGPVLAGSSKVVGLNINGQQINVIDQPVTIPANPLVVVAINEQTVGGGQLTQRALHVYSPLLGVDIAIAESIADYEGSCEIPAQVREIPAQVREIPAQVREIPAQVREIPAQVREIPGPGTAISRTRAGISRTRAGISRARAGISRRR